MVSMRNLDGHQEVCRASAWSFATAADACIVPSEASIYHSDNAL